MGRARIRVGTAVLAMMMSTLAVPVQQAAAEQPPPEHPSGAEQESAPSGETGSSVAPQRRGEVLQSDWKTSGDLAWTTVGDATGFHLLTAKASTGYSWRTVATLSEQGIGADRWIGSACVTGSGKRAVVVYAPRTYTNDQELAERGAFTAVVDLTDGKVTKTKARASLTYFNPGCGAGETAVLTQEGHEQFGKTRLLTVDARTGKLDPVVTEGQVTSAVPAGQDIVAARGGALVRVAADGTQSTVAKASGTPFHVAADADGGVVFMERSGNDVQVRRVHEGKARTVATGALSEVQVASGKGGRVFVTGKARNVARNLPRSVSVLDVPANAAPSTLGQVSVTDVQLRRDKGKPAMHRPAPGVAEPVAVAAKVAATGAELDFTVRPDPAVAGGGGNAPHPELGVASIDEMGTQATGSPTNPVEAERWCSVPRNDPNTQVYQPTLRQVEWAVNQAVQHSLHTIRPSNWKESGLSSWTPQGMFPPIPLEGGGEIPAQIMLGVLTQESNMSQASWHALPGVSANPLIGNYYGRDYADDASKIWDVNFSDADCGYGMSQVTDGMRVPEHEKDGVESFTPRQQRAIALDYATNLTAGMQILQKKWNQTRRAGLTINNGDSSKIENWFFAVWAYNSGFYPEGSDASGQWGVGWFNNPVNPRYPADRLPFLEYTYHDAAHPQDWPYPEKVIGWAGHPLADANGSGYRAAWWNGVENRVAAKPPLDLFCNGTNSCDASQEAAPCQRGDYKCWYHEPATWKADCDYSCGNEFIRFNTTYPEQPDGTNYPPNCDLDGLPSNALIVDDVADSVGSVRPNCGHPWSNAGSFNLRFASDSGGEYPSKVDFHQIGGGFGGHFWFAHTRQAADWGGKMEATGTWQFNQQVNGWGRVLVHMPDHGAHTQQAHYEIDTGSGTFTEDRYLSQGTEAHRWVSAGVYPFNGTPRIRLSSETEDGFGEEDVAWDAVAIQPLPGKPQHIVAALGDSYASGEGAGSYYTESDNNHGTARWAACRRSQNAWSRKMILPGMHEPLGKYADRFSTSAELGFVACSGALTWNLIGDFIPSSWNDPGNYASGEGQFREMSQIRSGVLTEHTTLVTLTIGGNDAGFTAALTECGGLGNCADEEFLQKYKGNIDDTQPKIAETLRDIAREAPNAQIVLMGYPEIFSRTEKCAGSWYFDMTEVEALAELGNYMAQKEAATVSALAGNEGVNVDFANPIPAFVGHGGCDEDEWINKFVSGPNGDGDFHDGDANATCMWWPGSGPCLSRESFHPKDAGTTGYARVMERKLDAIGYGS